MPTHERIIDHVVVLVSKEQQKQIIERLDASGFPDGDLVMEENFDLQAYLAPIGGGGFLELPAVRTSGSTHPLDGLVDLEKTPRALSASYTTMDAAADLAAWSALGLTEAHAMCGNWRRQNGTMGYWTAVAPQKISFQPFFCLQERRLFPLPYLQYADTAPRLTKIVVTGADADVWRQRHIDWFGLREKEGSVYAGETEIAFRQASNPGFELSYFFQVPKNKGTIPLVNGGSIEFV